MTPVPVFFQRTHRWNVSSWDTSLWVVGELGCLCLSLPHLRVRALGSCMRAAASIFTWVLGTHAQVLMRTWQVLYPLLWSAFYYFDTTMTKVNLEEKGVIWLTGYGSPCREARAGTWRQELRQSSWRRTAYSLFHCSCSAIFPIQLRPTCLGNCTTRDGLSPPTSVSNQENAPQTCPQSNQPDRCKSPAEVSSSQVHQVHN